MNGDPVEPMFDRCAMRNTGTRMRASGLRLLTQAEVAERLGTTQSAIARLESASAKHSPSIATLQRYAEALGHRVEVRLVKA